ncbi:MAG: hypothetical protein ACRBN8_14050 [Nannocystales bacterium]
MIIETQRRLGVCAALLLCAASCDKGSVGEFGETEGEAGSDSQGTTAGVSEGASAGSMSDGMTTIEASTTTPTESTGEGSSDSGIRLDIGEEGFCENPQHGCQGPADCGDNCGALDSMFDENGCVRVACGANDPCSDGEFCYRPSDYGGCQSSDLSCTEFDGACSCGLDPDCGGAYCVPESAVFGGIVEGPTVGLVSSDCGPDDGPAFSISVGPYISDACGGAFDPGPLLTIFVAQEFGTLGTTTSGDGLLASARFSTDGTPENTQDAQWVVLHLTEWEGTVSGDYEVLLEDETLVVGTFLSVVSCPTDIVCG